MDIKFNYSDTLSTSTSQDDLELDFSSKDKTLISAKDSTPFTFPTALNTNTDVNTDDVISSSTKRDIIVNIEPSEVSYVTNHTRDFYRGRSFRYAGIWTKGVHYISDEYVVDFVVKDNALLACTKSHMSSTANEPSDWVIDDKGEKYGILSEYWDLVITGVSGSPGEEGGVYLPSYDEENDRLVWTLVPPEDLESPIYVYLGINEKIQNAISPLQSEIDGIQNDITDIRSDISNLNGDISNLELITTHISSDISGINSNLDSLEQRVSDNEGNIGQLWLTSKEFGVKMSDLEGNVGQLTLTAREFSVQMENMQGDVGRLWLTAQEFGVRMSNAEGDVSLLKQTADEIQTRVENAEGDISQIHQRADEIWTQVENNQGDISRISQRADQIQTQVENNAGDISRITQRADEISSQVENAQGDISRIQQRADSIESTVQDAQDNISQIRQTATEISSRVENVEGDISQIRQTADEISTRVENNEGDISQLRQTATEISATVESNKTLTDGAIAENRSLISQTAEQIRTEVASNVTRLDGEIEQNRSEIRQTAEEITATVERNKQETDGAIESAKSEFKQTADEISATVERNKIDVDGQIESARSEIRQTADEISATVEANKKQTDGSIAELSSNITQTAEQIRSEVSAQITDINGEITETRSEIQQTASEITATVEANKSATDASLSNLSSEIKQTAEEISSTVNANKAEADGSISELSSRITQTAEEISSTVEANKKTTDGQIEQISSNITQTASEIRSEVSASVTDLDGQIQETKSELKQTAESFETRVSNTEGQISSINQDVDSITARVSNNEGKIAQLEIDTDSISAEVSDLSADFGDYQGVMTNVIENLQNQIDGAIETWYAEGEPALNKYPVSDWSQEDYVNHIGDLYYDKQTGKAYRFMLDESQDPAVYKWTEIQDSDIAKALGLAGEKKRIFGTTPTVPYDLNDLWVKDREVTVDGITATVKEIYRCVHARVAGETIDLTNDWAPADDYSTTVNKANFKVLSDAILGQVIEYTYNNDGTISNATKGLIKTTADSVRLAVVEGAVGEDGVITNALLPTGIDIINGNITLTADHVKLQNQGAVTGLELITIGEAPNQRVVIDTASLNVNGIFSTSPGSVWAGIQNDIEDYVDTAAGDAQSAAEATAKGYADTAEQQAKNYADQKASGAITSANTYVNTLLYGENGDASDPKSGSIAYAINTLGTNYDSLDTRLSDMGYLAKALWDGDTAVAGGLIASSLIQLGSKTYNGSDTAIKNTDGTITPGELNKNTWKVWSGLNGVFMPNAHGNGIAAWYGGAMLDRYYSGNTDANRAAKSLFRFDGSGYLASNNLRWDASGNLTVDGYILTHEVQLKDNNGNITAGISGLYDSNKIGNGIAAWYGGQKKDLRDDDYADDPTAAVSLFRMDGSGYLSNGRISWDDTGSLYIDKNVVIGDNNETLNNLVQMLADFYSWFEVVDKVNGQYITIDGVRRKALHLKTGTDVELAGLYADGFISAGGLSTGGGSEGVSPTGMWDLLNAQTNEQINKTHLTNALSGYINTITNSGTGDFVTSISKTNSTLTVTYGNFPESIKNPHSITIGSKSYDGSVDVTILASDLGISSWATANTKPSYGLSEITGTDDLQEIEILTGVGFLKRGTNNTWSLDNNTYLTTGDAASTYQPLDDDLTAIASISIGTGLLKRTVSGNTVTWTIDTNKYITGNQTITLSGDISGSGTTSITTTIGEGKVTNDMLAGSIANAKLANSNISINGSSVSLGGSFVTASITGGTAGQSTVSTGAETISIPYVTVNKYGIVTAYGTHTHTINDLPNSALKNSKITIGTTVFNLGDSSTTLAGLTKITSTTYSAGGKLEDDETESTITYDAANHAWKITGNIYATGFVSAGGLSTSGSGGSSTSVAFVDYAAIKTLSTDDSFTTATAWATHLLYQDIFGSGSSTIASRISALENSSINVTYTASQSSGTLLGTITIDGDANKIYAPTIPTSLKNPKALTFGSKSYDGSAEKEIKAEDLSACVIGTVVGTVKITT